MPRDYKKEYKRDHATAKAKKDRAARNTARNRSNAAGKTKKGDGKDVDHKDGNPRNNSKSNTRVQSRKTNRAAGAKKVPRSSAALGGRTSRGRKKA